MDTTNTRMRRQIDALRQGVDELRRAAHASEQIRIRENADTETARQLARIEAALSRMASGSYGYCKLCGEPVSLSRLERDPAAAICDGCES